MTMALPELLDLLGVLSFMVVLTMAFINIIMGAFACAEVLIKGAVNMAAPIVEFYWKEALVYVGIFVGKLTNIENETPAPEAESSSIIFPAGHLLSPISVESPLDPVNMAAAIVESYWKKALVFVLLSCCTCMCVYLWESWQVTTNDDENDTTTPAPSSNNHIIPADDLICPISCELPWDPVTAEDGRVYDRKAIEAYFNNHLKSPVTNEPMGKKLLPALWVRNHIQTLIDSGVLIGDLAAKWNEKVAGKKAIEDLWKKAEAEDAHAMFCVGYNYHFGEGQFERDYKLAFEWHEKASNAGNVKSTACVGAAYLDGRGVTIDNTLGLVYSTRAAEQGSNLGMYYLGMAFADGKFGVNKNKKQAVHWLTKCMGNCRYAHLSANAKDRAQKKLEELNAETD